MPLMKQRGFKFSILCDVFLLLSLQSEIFRAEIVLNLPTSTGLDSNNSDPRPILYSEKERGKSPDNKDAYKDFTNEAIHRILRDEETAYTDDGLHIRQRWRKTASSRSIQKRSVAHVNKLTLFFDNNNNLTESSDDSTKAIVLADRNLTDAGAVMNLVTEMAQSNLSAVATLNLTRNRFHKFILSELDNLTSLHNLDLSSNYLKDFEIHNSSLRSLNLSGNQVSNFSVQSNNLKELVLRSNHLNSLKYLNISGLKDLRSLDLSCNKISDVKTNFFGQLKSLRRLDLSMNQLGSITKEPFYNLLSTETLILSHNNITTIDLDTFLDLPNLQYIDLSHNNIQGGSVRALQGIPDLVGLSIAYNPDLGSSLQEFVSSWSLKELDASGTGLCRIPAALAQSVRALKLTDNWFSVIRCGDLDSYPLLQYLDLSYSHINEIEEDALGRLEVLETLFLDHNNLRRVPISLPSSLEHLFLHSNQIMDIQPHTFQSLANLKTLDLSGNKLIYLPGLPLPKLLTLNLQSSELRGLSQSIVKTSTKLRDLLLDGNPIKCSDLLGIAEWASPCQSDRITQLRDIKEHFQEMHIHFKHFRNNQGFDLLCKAFAEPSGSKSRKPKCADSNVKFIQSNKLESQLQGMEDILKSKRISNANLLHFLSSLLGQASDLAGEVKNSGEEEMNTIQRSRGISRVVNNNRNETLPKVYEAAIRNEPSSRENTAAENENDQKSGGYMNGPFGGSDHVPINEETSSGTKTPILSFQSNSVGSTTTSTTSSNMEGPTTEPTKNVTQEQQHGVALSKIKSDNNYVETSVLLGQESPVEDGGANRGKFVKQVGIDDPQDSNFKSENIDSVPKAKENILSHGAHIRDESSTTTTTGAPRLHKIDEGNRSRHVPIKSTRANPEPQDNNSKRPGRLEPLKGTQIPAATDGQLALRTAKRENLSGLLSPAERPQADEVIKRRTDQRGTEPINSSRTTDTTNFRTDTIAARGVMKRMTTAKPAQDLDMASTTTKTLAPDKFSSVATGPPTLALSQKMMTSKVNKADKVVFIDQPSAVDENGIIKQRQNVSLPLGQHYQQIQRAPSKGSHLPSVELQQQQQNPKEDRSRTQRRLKLQTTDTVHGNQYNKESQQKLQGAALNQLNSDGIPDMDQELRGEEPISVIKSLDHSAPKVLANGAKYPIKQRQKDMHIQGNFANQNQIDKDVRFGETMESAKIERILGRASNSVSAVVAREEDVVSRLFTFGPFKKVIKIPPERQRKPNYSLNVANDAATRESLEEDEEFSFLATTKSILLQSSPIAESHHTVNTENLQYTSAMVVPDYRYSRDQPQTQPQPTRRLKLQAEIFSYANSEPNPHRFENHLKVNKELSLDRSQIPPTPPTAGATGAPEHPGLQGSNSSGLPPEQWLDVRTATGHPGLFVVIGVTFGLLFGLGLIHIYRCRRPWGGGYTPHGSQFHNHSRNHNSATETGDYCNCSDDYYIEMDQESQSSAQKDFLPMELLSTTSRRLDGPIPGW